MCVSVFSATATPVFAANQAESIFTVEHTEYKNDRITYTISINPNQTNLIGTIIKVDYDNKVLELSSDSGAAGALNEYNEFAANVTGYYEDGITTDGEEDYAVAYMNPNGFNIGSKAKAFIKVAFNVIGEEGVRMKKRRWIRTAMAIGMLSIVVAIIIITVMIRKLRKRQK